MAIYVQSRGKNQDEDYRWLKIKENEHSLKTPDFLLQPLGNLPVKPVDLIESQKFSIVLVKSNRYFCLLITGLKAKESRNDFQGRRVRNSLFWICDTTEIQNAEAKVRSLLIRALHGELEQEIDSAIVNGGKHGFEVKRNYLERLLNSPLLTNNINQTELAAQIGSNSKSSRQQLASDLQTCSLPKRNGVLVLITSIKSLSALQEIGVWRGLSNRIKDEEDPFAETVDRQAQKKTIFLGIAIALVLIIAIAILTIKLTKIQKLQPETIPTPSTIQQDSSSTSTEELNPSVDLIKAKEINCSTSSNMFNEGYGT